MFTKYGTSLLGRCFLIAVLVVMELGVMPAQPVSAAAYTVTNTNDSGPGSLRQAIADAGSWDVITFHPSLAGAMITLASDLEISYRLTIDGSGLTPQLTISGGDVAHLVISSSAIVTISNLTITHGNGGGIVSSGDLTVLNSTLKDNHSTSNGGGIYSSGTLTLRNSTITNNQASLGGGIAITANTNNSILNSTIVQNTASTGGGISVHGNAVVEVNNSTFAGNSAPQGAEIEMVGAATQLLATNTIFVCTPENSNCYTYPVPSNISQTNSILGVGTLSDYGIAALADNGGPTQTMALLPGSQLLDAGNDVNCPAIDQRGITRPKGSHCDIGAYEAYEPQTLVRYVKQDANGLQDGSSWANAYTDLQSALTVAFPEEEIWVAAGTYKPTTGSDRSLSFNLRNGVALYGGFAGGETSLAQRDLVAHPTILSGDIGNVGDSSDNSYHVVVGSGTNNSAILDGFVVSGGNANLSPNDQGGGLYVYQGEPLIANTTIKDNAAYFLGGGVYIGGNQFSPEIVSHPVLTNLIIKNNTAAEGGGLVTENYIHAVMTDIVFDGNTATRSAGGMEARLGTLVLTNVVFKNNTAPYSGGMQNFSQDTTFVNVTFSGNSATYGGGLVNANVDPVLTNVTFYANTAEQGGGMWNSASKPVLTNVTFYNNSASAFGGAIYSDATYNQIGSQTTLRNAILWGNTAPTGAQIYNDGTSIVTGSNSVVQGGLPGGTNIITTDPKLGTPGNYGGFSETIPLLAGSSAIDTGNDASCPATDQRGVTRPKGSHCDIGAYEYEDLTPPTVISIVRADPNPTSASTVSFTVTFSENVINVGTEDFSLATSGVSGATIANVSGAGASYTVTVNTGSGNGTVHLDLVDDDSIRDLANLPLGGTGTGNGNYTSGQSYDILWITISGNTSVAGVTLSYTDGSQKTVITDGSGNYSFTVPYKWTGTVTPSKAGYTFSPSIRTYANITVDQLDQNYTDIPITFTISGNAGVAGTVLSYTDGSPKTATADGGGNYSFTVAYGWSGTVTPSKTGCTFSPAARIYSNLISSQTSEDYTAAAITYTISGNTGVGGTILSYTDGTLKTVEADGSGSYSFSVSYDWSGTVTPSKTGYTFSPVNKTYSHVLADQTAQNYAATPITFTISGSAGVAGATLSYTDGVSKTATADGNGNYSFSVSYNWSGAVTPSRAGYTFSPVYKTYTNILANQTGQNYTAIPITYAISGKAGVGGATLSYTDGSPKTATADSGGNYSFTVSYDWSGTVIPSKSGYTFVPASRTYSNVRSNQAGQDYSAYPPPSAQFDAWPQNLNVGGTVQFHLINTSNITACSWDYGDGSETGTSCSPYHPHTYNKAGFHTVTLSVTGPGGSDSVTILRYITVYPTLVVSKTGNGTGTVTSDLGGINCGSTCAGNINYNTVVRLTATPTAGSTFIGWNGGGCSGTDSCTINVQTATETTAHFEKIVAVCPSITDWKGEYWVNSSLSGTPVLCRNDASLNFDWRYDRPDPSIPFDNFSAQWTRTINLSGGSYLFHIDHDDGARLYVDNMVTPVMDKWGTCCVVDTSSPITLSEGNHVIRMDYYEGGGAANAHLWWEKVSPDVISITRADSDPTSASSVHFNVTFSENVTNVDASDFTLTTTGVTGASVTGVAGSGATRTITVKTGSGNGNIRLNVTDNDSILNGGGFPLGGAGNGNGDFNSGETYTVRKNPTFIDVPTSHRYYQDIEILYANGLTGGCSTSPLKFCPDQIMNRGQAAVFILRANFGSGYVPPVPTHIFQDDWSKGTWAESWAEGMRAEGLSAGCLINPLKYCPWSQIPREQAVIFALRMKYGTLYTPPPATGTVFADMTNPSYYATSWAEQAYKDGLIPNCGMSAGKPKICPKDLVSRGLAAYMIVRAKNLSMP